jgi:hypothetical protein
MSRRYFRHQMARDRASRNMSALRRMGNKELYLRGIGQGLIFLLIGCVILWLNIQNAGRPSFVADLRALPDWAVLLGGGVALFGLCWAVKNAWLFASQARASKQMAQSEKLPDRSAPLD